MENALHVTIGVSIMPVLLYHFVEKMTDTVSMVAQQEGMVLNVVYGVVVPVKKYAAEI